MERIANLNSTRDKKKNDLEEKVFITGKNIIGIERLGKGTYGSVYKVQKKDTKEILAIKKIKLDVDTEGIPSTTLREVSILKKLKHANIVKLFDIAMSDSKVELSLEYLPLDLRKFIDLYKDNSKVYNPKTIKYMIHQILKGTDYIHSKKIFHRDLKPQNILVCDRSLSCKLADFGLSRVFSIPIRPYTKEVLTLWYRAPELMLGLNQYGVGLDMWSIGCIFGEMFMKVPLIKGDSEVDQLFKIFQIFGTPTDEVLPGYKFFPDFNKDFPIWKGCGLYKYLVEKTTIEIDPKAFDLIQRMLVIDPCRRISAKEALAHVK
jgi:serine/threonine protein kinase